MLHCLWLPLESLSSSLFISCLDELSSPVSVFYYPNTFCRWCKHSFLDIVSTMLSWSFTRSLPSVRPCKMYVVKFSAQSICQKYFNFRISMTSVRLWVGCSSSKIEESTEEILLNNSDHLILIHNRFRCFDVNGFCSLKCCKCSICRLLSY